MIKNIKTNKINFFITIKNNKKIKEKKNKK